MCVKGIIRYCALLLGLSSSAVLAGPNIQHWTTDQGTRVYYVQTEGLPLVDVRVVFDAGSARDGEQYGAAHLASTLLDTGAAEWNADAIAQRLEGVGAQLGTDVSHDSAWLSLRSLTEPRLLGTALETTRAILTQPRFAEEDFAREKQRLLMALHRREESPDEIANMTFYQALYGEHPYAHPTEGTIEKVEKLTREDVVEFYERYYVAENAIAVIVGDVSRRQAASMVASLLGDLPVGSRAPSLPPVPEPSASETIRRAFPSAQTHILSGMPALRRKDPDYFALYVGNHILGGSGLVSLISEKVREERGLSYSAYSYFMPLKRKGPFTMGLQTRNDQAEEALGVMRKTLKAYMEKGPTAEQLEAAKKNITGGFVLRYDSNQNLAEYVAMIGFYELPLDYLDSFPNRVEAVSREDIQEAFQHAIDPEHFKTVLVGGGAE